MRALLLAAAVLCAGCLQPIEQVPDDGGTQPGEDGGTMGGGKDGGVMPDPDGGTSGGDGGSDGGTTGDSDGGTAPGPLTWGKMTLPTSTRGLYDVAGTAKNYVFAVGTHGQVLHYNGIGWTKVAQSPSNLDLQSVYVAPNGAVFAGGTGQLVHCLSGCTQAQNFIWTSNVGEIGGVCGKDENTVFATGIGGTTTNRAGRLYQFNPGTGTWTLLLADTDSYSNTECWMSPSGAVFMAAQSKVIRYENSVLTAETINFPPSFDSTTIAYQYFETIWGSGTHVFAAGYRRGVIARNEGGTWDYIHDATGIDNYYALAGTGPTDVIVGGVQSGDSKYLRQYSGTAWTTPQSLPNLDVWGLAAVDAKTFFAAGSNSLDGAIWIGTRP